MLKIVKPTINDLSMLVDLAKETFVQSHGHSAPVAEIEAYLNTHYTLQAFERELADPTHFYDLLFLNETLVGYSKLKFNQPVAGVLRQNIAKLDRIYLVESQHGLGLGEYLMNFNLELAKAHNQHGVWLYTWIENKRAVAFYKKMGFEIIGKYDFKLSDTHSNPNHQFFLRFD